MLLLIYWLIERFVAESRKVVAYCAVTEDLKEAGRGFHIPNNLQALVALRMLVMPLVLPQALTHAKGPAGERYMSYQKMAAYRDLRGAEGAVMCYLIRVLLDPDQDQTPLLQEILETHSIADCLPVK